MNEIKVICLSFCLGMIDPAKITFFTLTSVIQNRERNMQSTLVAFMDFSKVFVNDSDNRELLL